MIRGLHLVAWPAGSKWRTRRLQGDRADSGSTGNLEESVRSHFTHSRAVRTIVVLAVLGATAGVGAQWASAVHDTGKFQLDGDARAATQPFGPAAADDWDNVCHEVTITDDLLDGVNNIPDQCASVGNTSGAAAVSWTNDGAAAAEDASVFTGGGSKDPQLLDDWLWKPGGTPDKDNLLHSFAARYSLPDSSTCDAGTESTCEVLYFGSDRFDNSGDAQQGFWFFQNPVTLSNVKSQGGFKFNGEHENGDVLIISNFSNGGTTSTISVYQWNDTVTGNLQLLEEATGANCATAGANDGFCGIVNGANGTVAPWAFLDKSGNNTYLQGELYEGGINLSLLGLGGECFSSVLSETRSSTSTTAVLKDFVLGQFANCQATLTTQVSDTSVNPGEPVHDTATVVGSSASNTPTGDVEFFLCSFAQGSTDVCSDADAAHHGVSLGTQTLSGAGATATADTADINTAGSPLTPGHYCFRAEWPGDSNYTTPLVHFQPNECFDVVQSGTTTVTEPRLASTGTAITTAVPVNTQVVDHALITGAAGFGTPSGVVNFFICNPSQVTGAAGSEVCAAGNGTALSGNPVTATAVQGSNPPQSEATSSPAVTANVVGVWCFRSTYVPDTANYTGSVDNSHGECFTVQDSASLTTAQNWLPNDTATVTAAGGTALNGTLTFQLYTGGNCGATSGAAVAGQNYTRTLTNAVTLADRTKSTSNTTYFVTADATVSWKVTFVSSDPKVTNPTSTSCEITTLDLTQ